MAVITVPGMFLTGDHASRPAATAVGGGTLYACSTHGLIYQSDAASWTTWATLGGDVGAHLADTTDAHDASAVSVVPAGTIASTNVQAALEELDGDIVAGGIPATILDAKGDLIAATAADTAARLAVISGNGSSLIVASGESTGLKWQLNKLDATAAPAVTDDSGDGYSVGSIWIDVTGDAAFICVDASVGAAVWNPFEGGGGGSGYIATITAESGITAYWPLNEEGTTYADAIGSADMTALATTPGFCATLTKDSTGGSLHIPSATFRIGRAAFTWGASFTIEGWVIPGTDFVFGQWNGAGSMLLKSGAQVYAYSGGSSINFTPTAAELAGRHHVALTHDGTDLRLYWDGVLKAGPTTLTIPGTNVGGSWRVGSYSDTTTVGTAIYSDIAFYSGRVLTAGELLAHYNLGA